MCDFKGSVVPLMDPDEVPCSELREIVHSSEIYGRGTSSSPQLLKDFAYN